MAHQGSFIAAVVMAVVMGWTSSAAASGHPEAAVASPSITESHARVRGVGPRVAAVVKEAAAQSKTVRGLVNRISSTDGIVYISEGQCGHGVRACLLNTMIMAGPNRVLRIVVDPQKVDRELMASIGHELQHVVEVLSRRNVRSSSAITMLYLNSVCLCGGRFETDAAVQAGNAVQRELQKSAAAGKRRE